MNVDTRDWVMVFLRLRSLPVLLWVLLRRRRVIIVGVGSSLSPLNRVLERLRTRLVSLGLAEDSFDYVHPDERETPDSWLMRYPDMFVRVEPVVWDLFHFGDLKQADPSFALYVKHVASLRTDVLLRLLMRLRTVRHHLGESGLAKGLPSELQAFERQYFDSSSGPVKAGEGSFASALARVILAGMVLVDGVVRAARRFRFTPTPPRPVFMGSDITSGDLRHSRLLKDVCGNRSVLLVMRNSDELRRAQNCADFDEYELCSSGDGQLGPADIGAMFAACCQLVRLAWDWRHLPEPVYGQAVRWPFLKLKYKALSNRYTFKYFFGKDDYNSEHIARTDVLRRQGVTNLGIAHGMPVPECVQPVWRYIDFDVYFIFGLYIYEEYYRDTWPSHMKVVSSGTYGLPNSGTPGPATRPRDFIVLYSGNPDNDLFLAELSELAAAFPDRTFYVKHKRSLPHAVRPLAGRDTPWQRPANVVETGERIYDLFAHTSYAVCVWCTTAVVEAIEYGLAAFVLDPVQRQGSFWRAFPDIEAISGAEIAERVSGIENGTWTYPLKKFEGIANLAGVSAREIIRNEIKSA